MRFRSRVLTSFVVPLLFSLPAQGAAPDAAMPPGSASPAAPAAPATVATSAASAKAAAPPASARPAGLSLSGTTKLALDATCVTCQSGTLDIYIRNNTTKAIPLSLRVGDFVGAGPTETLSAKITQELFISDRPTSFRGATLKAKDILHLRLSISGVLEEGEWSADLYNDNDKLGTLSVVRALPFDVDLDLRKPHSRDISVQKGESLFLPLTNKDLLEYPVNIELTVKNRTVSVPVKLSPKGSANQEIAAGLLRPWFDNPWEGYFRTETVTGRLVMVLQRPPCPSDGCPARATPLVPHFRDLALKIHLKYHSPEFNFLAIAFVLFAGAICSLLIGSFLPNQLRRIQLKRELDAMAARIRDLPMQLSSRLRVSLGLDEKRCLAALSSQAAFAPGFAAVLADVKKHMESLAKRLTLTEQLADLRVRFDAQRLHCLFPTPMDIVAASFEAAVDLLRGVEVSDDDVQSAQAIVKSLSDKIHDLDDIKRMGADLVSQIKDRASRLLLGSGTAAGPYNYFSKWPAESSSPSLHKGCQLAEAMLDELRFRAWRKRATDQERSLATEPPGKAADNVTDSSPPEFLQEDLPDVDRLSLKLEMLRDCARLDNGDRSFGRDFAELVKLLESQNAEQFDAAKRLSQQIKERVFARDVVREIAEGASQHAVADKNRVHIEIETTQVCTYQPIQLRVLFSREDLNCSEAIKDFVPIWNFGHDDLTDEYGWDVVHYFPRAQSYIVKVSLQWRGGGFVRPSDLDSSRESATAESDPVHTAGTGKLHVPVGSRSADHHRLPAGAAPPASSGDDIVVIKRRVKVKRMRRNNGWSFFLEAAQLLVAIVPALFAVRGGVLGELSKQSLFSGLVGVFVIGFTSDRVKSLLTQKST
jgi:hypothetical protein